MWFLYLYLHLLISYSETVVTQVSEAWEKRKSCEVHKWENTIEKSFLVGEKRVAQGWVKFEIELEEACYNKEHL